MQDLFEELKKKANVQCLDIVLLTIEVFISNDNMQRIAKGGRKNVLHTRKRRGEESRKTIFPV